MKIKIVTTQLPPHAAVRGADTFYRDFCNTVLNDLCRMYDVTIEDGSERHTEYDVVYTLIGIPKLADAYRAKKVIIHAHNNYVELWRQERIADIQKIASIVPELIIIYHCEGIAEFLREKFPTAHKVFQQHYIDTWALPVSNRKNGRFIFYGNVDESRIGAITSVKNIVDFDVLSYGSLNGVPLSTNHLKEISAYSYGIGSGRCLLEMMGMGLKCLTLGRKYGGPILNDSDFIKHQQYNFNGMVSTSCGDILHDFDNIKMSNYGPNLGALDIRNYINPLIKMFENTPLKEKIQ